jgi:hypothetical protein
MDHGYQGVQSLHVMAEFALQYPEVTKEWHEKSNYLGFLSAKNEHDLIVLMCKATGNGIRVAEFREPDVGDRVTAIALEPGSKSRKLCSNLPLALRR